MHTDTEARDQQQLNEVFLNFMSQNSKLECNSSIQDSEISGDFAKYRAKIKARPCSELITST